MINRTVVIRRNSSKWQPKTKRNITFKPQKKVEKSNAGFISPVGVVVVFTILAGLFYLYTINQSATKGFQIQQTEKEIAQIKSENEKLQIKEAQLKSLYNIEQSIGDLNMAELKDVNYVDENSTMAFGKSVKN